MATKIFDKISRFRAKDTRCLNNNGDGVVASEQFRVFVINCEYINFLGEKKFIQSVCL